MVPLLSLSFGRRPPIVSGTVFTGLGKSIIKGGKKDVYAWGGPHFIVPSEMAEEFSGAVLLRERFDQEFLRKEPRGLGIEGAIIRATNPWYFRRKNNDSWIKIGESEGREGNFPVKWDTTRLEDGTYEILGLIHVFVRKEKTEKVIARQNIVEVTVKN